MTRVTLDPSAPFFRHPLRPQIGAKVSESRQRGELSQIRSVVIAWLQTDGEPSCPMASSIVGCSLLPAVSSQGSEAVHAI
jgi:hypothetical protein